MALFSEYAVTPDVFNKSCYDSPALCDVYFRQLLEVFFSEGLVRNLRNGEWQAFFSTHARHWHYRIKHILKNLTDAGRLIPSDPALSHTPQTDREWCNEALESHKTTHKTTPLNGIIVSDAIRSTYRKNQLVESVSRLSLSTCAWWDITNGSLRLKRNISQYIDALKLILKHAKSIMFIDPNIDPAKSNYANFIQLLEAAGNRPSQSPQPLVEIHRKSLRGSGKNAPLWDQPDMENTFRNEFGPVLSQSNLKAEVFIWDNFHDRYLISNLGGILVPYGFDTSSKPDDLTTWSRLRRSTRDDVQREFARESNKHKLQFNFTIP